MEPVYMFGLASQHARWATVRQAVITGNIANANTPGYGAREVEHFEMALNEAAGLTMVRTGPGHIDVSGAAGGTDANWAVNDTGSAVRLDTELMKADDANRAFALDTSIIRAFHRMLIAAARTGA